MPTLSRLSKPADLTLSQLFSPDEWEEIQALAGIDGRLGEIAWLTLAGHPDKQIALKLNLSLGTVRTYVRRLHQRLGVADRTELAVKLFALFRCGYCGSNCRYSR